MTATTARPRQQVDRYDLLEPIGSGAFATVYRGRHVHTHQPVAVKILERHAEAASQTDRWLTEARAMAAIRHPNVVQILDCGRAATGEIFLVMELVAGESLSSMLEQRSLPVAHAVRLTLQMLDGLAAAHAKGIVHRDVKPANVLVTHDAAGEAVAKLLDFGVSKVTTPNAAAGTLPGTAIGTPGYMAPELFGDAANADARVDVYAVAATLFEMLAGRRPFLGPSYESYVIQVATQRPPPLAELAPHVPAALAEVVDRGLARDRDARWPSAAAFADALRGAISTRHPARPELDATLDARVTAAPPTPQPSVPPIPPPPRAPDVTGATLASRGSNPPATRRATWPLWVGGALLLVLAGAGTMFALYPNDEGAHATREPKTGTSETRSADHVAATGVDPDLADPTVETAPPATTSAPRAATKSSAAPVPAAGAVQGLTVVPVKSVTNHATDAAFATFTRALAPRAQSCRPKGAATTVVVQIMAHADEGNIAISSVHPRNTGDKAIATCVAEAFKKTSDEGGRLPGAVTVEVRVTLDPL